MTLLSKINKVFDSNFTLADIFRNQSIELVGKIVDENLKVKKREVEVLPKQEYYDLSHAQLRIYIQEQLVSYNVTRGFLLKGKLNIQVLELALKKVIERHEVLRTTFFEIKDQVKQKVLEIDEVSFQINFQNIKTFSGDKLKFIDDELAKEVRFKFDLHKAPLLRVNLYESL